MSNFQDYKEKKDALVGLINKSSGIIRNISLTQYAEGLRQLGQKVQRDTFKVQIVGTFKNGKSTFINALLGEDILPTKALPCTAVINEIKYGESKRAVLNFRNPLPETLLSGIPEATLAHMKEHNMKNVPPMEIEYDRISDYVTIPVKGDPKEISLTSPYLSVELFYPSDLLQEGVEIIDSPGFNENDERTAVTLEYLDKADAIICILDAIHACADDEMKTIKDILIPKGFDDMFIVLNRFDMIRPGEREEVKLYVETNVQPYTKNEIYCLSALNALDGKVEKNQEKLDNSGFLPFQTRLSEFLTKDKGRIKLAQPAKELRGILKTEALFKAIPSQKAQLSTDLHTLEARYESAKPQLDIYESQKKSLRENLELKVESKENKIRDAIKTQYSVIAKLVPAWIRDYQPEATPGVFGTKRQVQKVADEICKHVSSKVKENFTEWNTKVLVPLVEKSATEIFTTSDDRLKEILNGIDKLQSDISGTKNIQDQSSGWTRAFGVAGICFGFASGASLLAGQFDIKTVAKSLAVDLGVGTGLLLLGVANPILAIGGVVYVVWKAIAGGTKVVLKNIKDQLTPVIADSIKVGAGTKSAEIVAKIDLEFQKSIATAIQAIDIKINDLNTQIKAVLKEKQEGDAQTRLTCLTESETQLQEVCNELDNFVDSLIG